MHIFSIKSLLSLVMLFMVLIAGFTMFEVFGRTEKRFNAGTLQKAHRLNGMAFLLLYSLIAYFCLDFLVRTRTELSARAAFHLVFAVAVILLVILKILIATVYRQLYGRLQTIGMILLFATFGMIGTSAGYYLLTTHMGRELPAQKAPGQPKEVLPDEQKIAVGKDPVRIARGKEIYETKCTLCHDPAGYDKVVGPGHKHLLKNPDLPISKRPATPENVIRQLRTPFRDMPSFADLTDDQIQDLLAYLNTL